MSATTAYGMCIIVSAFILTVFSTILPYWTYVVTSGATHHAGLWRNCTVYTDTFECRNVTHVQSWFHAVQCLMVIGIVVLFITVISGCAFHSNVSRRKCCMLSVFSSVLGGVLLTSGVLVYGVENKLNSSSLSAGFYLSIFSAVLSFLAAVFLTVSTRTTVYTTLDH